MFEFPADYYSDVRIEKVFRTTIRIEMGLLEEVKEKSDTGVFIRLYDGKRWLYAATTDISSVNSELKQLAKLATKPDLAKINKVTARLEKNHGDFRSFSEQSVARTNLQEKTSLLKSYVCLLSSDKEITHWSASYSDSHIEKEFHSSLHDNGKGLHFDTQIAGLRLGIRFGSGSNAFSEAWCKAESTLDKLKNLHDMARDYIEKVRDYYHRAESIEGGVFTVILSPLAAGIFAHESFGHKSEADFMIGDAVMLKEWQIGKRVGSEKLSIIDDGNIVGSGYTPFDDEGNRAKRTPLIENGILRGRLHSSVTAADLNEEATGNARSVSFEFEPIVRMTTTFIEPGNLTKDELFAGVSHGIFIDSIKHGSGMSTFTLAPSMAYLIENGKVTRPVRFSVISGNVMQTLDHIDAVSNELEILSFVGGGCGKMEQHPLPVSFGGPYVRVSQINVQ